MSENFRTSAIETRTSAKARRKSECESANERLINCLPGLSGTHEQATLPGGCSIWRSCLGRKPRPPALMRGEERWVGKTPPQPCPALHGHSRKEEKKKNETRNRRSELAAHDLANPRGRYERRVPSRASIPHTPLTHNTTHARPSAVNWV